MNAFEKLKKAADEKNQKQGSRIIYLTDKKARGLVSIRIIQDNNEDMFFDSVAHTKLAVKGMGSINDEGKRGWLNLTYFHDSDYDPHVIAPYKEVRTRINSVIDRINTHLATFGWDSLGDLCIFRSKPTSFLAGKILSHTPKDGQNAVSKPYLGIIASDVNHFTSQLVTTVESRTKGAYRGDISWLGKYVSRTVGVTEFATLINTELKGKGYTITFDFAEGAPFEITQEDLDELTNIKSYLGLTRFDPTPWTEEVLTYLEDSLNSFNSKTLQQDGLHVDNSHDDDIPF